MAEDRLFYMLLAIEKVLSKISWFVDLSVLAGGRDNYCHAVETSIKILIWILKWTGSP